MVFTVLFGILQLLPLLGCSADLIWITKPQHTPVVPGQDLILHCRAALGPPSGGSLSYRWLFNQSQVQAKASLFANASLFVPQVSKGDEGEYTCLVTAENGGVVKQISASAEVVFAYIKDFIIHPQNAHIIIGSEAVLTCVTGRSIPYPTVHWELSRVKLDNANTQTATYGDYDETGLSFQVSMKLMFQVNDELERTFRCAAENPLTGRVVYSQEAKVTAERPKDYTEMTSMEPQIIGSSPPEVIARESQRLALPCQVIGYPTPLILWRKDNDFVDDSRVFLMADGTLIIPKVGHEDAGKYLCEAKNILGVAVSNVTSVLVAEIGLQFKTQPSDTSSLAGHPVTLQCSPPDSVPPATVMWYKDYVPFLERAGQFAVAVVRGSADSWDLHFSSVQKSDEGDYYCVASNSYSQPSSRTSRVARLTVHSAPVITEPPVNTEVMKGTLLHLSCRVDIATVQSVYWVFNGQRVIKSQTVSITDLGQNLWVTNVGKSWEGQYTCTAQNSYGQKTASASVTVIVPPVTLRDLGAQSVLEGNMILLPCFIYGSPDPSFVWYQDGQVIVEDDRHKVLTTGLFINPVKVGDRGNYFCQGRNRGGQAWSNGTLDVRVPPTAVANQSVAAVLGQLLTLTCTVHGHPQPSVRWLHNGTEVANISFLSSTGESTFIQPGFSWTMAGRYTCVAENRDGSVRADIDVAAQAVPKVLQIQGKTKVDISRTVNLTCVPTGVPSPVITWFHTGERVTMSLDGRISFPEPDTLLIKFAQKKDEGRYDCVTTNILGNSSSYVDLFVIEPPKPPLLLEAQPLSMNSVLLSWQHVFQAPETNVDTFIIKYRERVAGDTVMYPEMLSSLTTQWEVSGLRPNTEYIFTVSAENSAGQGLPSNSLSAVTFESGPSEPRNFRVLATEATRVKISWEVPAETNGNIRQYQLQYHRQDVNTEYTTLSVSSPVLPTQTLVLEDLLPYTSYKLRVRAANVWDGTVLWGQFSPIITVLTNMTKPSSPPANIRATSLDPFSVQVEWHRVPESSQHGPIIGYRLTYFMENMVTPLGTLLTNSSVNSLTIRGLSPWTTYSLMLEAENSKGFSPNITVNVKTLPTVPSAPPQGVTTVSLPGDIISVYWQPVPAKDRNCELAFYLVQYRLAGTTQWMELYTPDNKTLSVEISDVQPWSWYEVRVAGTTSQVTPGRSPFSSSVEIQTLQSGAGQVASVSFLASTISISLSWAPTPQPNGVVIGYRVDYHPVSPAEGEKKIVVLNTTHAELTHLLPGVLYNVSIIVINGAGAGQPTLLRIRTASLPPSASTALTTTHRPSHKAFAEEELGDMTTAASEGSSSPSRDLPVIVAGSLTGAAILFIILLIILCRCIKARRDHHAKYLIQDAGMSFAQASSGSVYRHIEESDVIVTTHQSTSSPLDHNVQQQQQIQQQQQRPQSLQIGPYLQHKDSTPQQLTDTAWLTQQSLMMEGGAKAHPVFLPVEYSGATTSDSNPSAFLNLPSTGSDVFTVEGIENPAFMDDPLSLPGLPSPDRAPEGAATPEGTEKRASAPARKRGRMRSESAAAIAVMRSATVASLASEDTESLLSNDYTNEFTNVDTQVVFNKRTVL